MVELLWKKLIDEEIYQKVKDYTKEQHRVKTYYEIGKILNDAGKHYGENIIEEYAKRLVNDIGKKYDKSTLFKIKKFYTIFSQVKVAPLEPQLTWSHYKELLPIKNINKIIYYIEIIKINNLSKRQLHEKIKSNEYERLPLAAKNKLIKKEEPKIKDYIKNPIIIHNTSGYSKITEKVLQQLILEDIPSFLEQLGNGFTFVKNEYKIKYNDY